VQQRVALRERNLGVLQGLTYADGPQAQPDAWAALQSSNSSVRVPGGESLDDLRARLTAAVLDIAAAHPGGESASSDGQGGTTHMGTCRTPHTLNTPSACLPACLMSAGQRVIVVSHGGALHALHAVARGYQARGKVANCSLTVLLAEADETVLQQQHQHQHQQPASVPGASSSSMQVAAEGHGDTQAAADDDPASPCQDSCAGAEGSSSSRAARHPSSQRCGSGCVQGGRLALLSWNEVDAQLQSETGFGGSSRAG
jgi:broad specificity phosphatase PhoE